MDSVHSEGCYNSVLLWDVWQLFNMLVIMLRRW